MKVFRIVAMGSALATMLSVPALAADARTGERIAKRWCAECHVVARDQKNARADAPSFADIAKRRGKDTVALLSFLMHPHPKMPDMQIGRAEAADLIAYIETQKEP